MTDDKLCATVLGAVVGALGTNALILLGYAIKDRLDVWTIDHEYKVAQEKQRLDREYLQQRADEAEARFQMQFAAAPPLWDTFNGEPA